jgi:hypothetical protein
LFDLLSLFRKGFLRHSECCDIVACAIGPTAGHINHILKASPKDLGAGISIAQLLGVVLVRVGASDRNGLSLNLGVEPSLLARVAFNGARMGGDLGGVLVVDDAHFERIGVVRANAVGGSGLGSSTLTVKVAQMLGI